MSTEFQAKPGESDAMTALAAGLQRQATDSGLVQHDAPENAPPEAVDHDIRAEHDRRMRAKESLAPEPREEPQEGEEPAEEPVEAAEAPQEGEEAQEEAQEAPPAAEGDVGLDAVVVLEDGSEMAVSELASGYIRQADYTRKTQEVAEQRKAMEGQAQGMVQQWQQYEVGLQNLANQLQTQINEARNSPEMRDLEQNEPGEYAKRVLHFQQRQEMVNAAGRAQVELATQQQQARIPFERHALATKNKAFAENFDAAYSSTGAYVTNPEGGGLPLETWNGVFDHRMIDMAWKAMKYDAMQRDATGSVAPRIRKQATRPRVKVRPGVSLPAKTNRETAAGEYERAIHDKDGMRTNEGIARALLALKAKNMS